MERYEVSSFMEDNRFGVIDTSKPKDDDTRVVVTCDTKARATLTVDELNRLQKQIDEKPMNLEEDFSDWDNRIEWLNKTTERLVEIEREYEKKSPVILQKAIEDEVDFKALYGGNTEKNRKKYVDEQLSELLLEKERLKLFKENDNRRISFLKRLIDMKIEMIRYL